MITSSYPKKNRLFYLILVFLFFSCGDCPGCFNNCPDTPDTSNNPVDRHITVTNKTGHDNLKIYFIHKAALDSCSQLTFLTTVNNNGTFTYHVPPGEIHAIYFGAPGDLFCTDYDSKIVKGIVGQPIKITLP